MENIESICPIKIFTGSEMLGIIIVVIVL